MLMIKMAKIARAAVSVAKRSIQTVTSRVDPVQDKAMNETCILVNENDEDIGFASKRDCHFVSTKKDLLLHRAFSLLLFNSKNELVLQKRSPTKITYPNYLSNTCCSHPLYDIECERETDNAIGIKLAARRRLNIELGVPLEDIDINSMEYVTRVHYKSFGDGVWGEHEIDYILIMQKDISINPNPDEVCEVINVSKNQLKSCLCNSPLIFSPWFRYFAESESLLNYWWDNLHQLDKIKDHDNIFRCGLV